MEFDHKNVRGVVEDRLSSLPDELIHQILSCMDMKYVVQTCSLSSRWKILWTSMPCLNFSSWRFGSLPKFSKFVTSVLSHRNHEVEVSCVKLRFSGATSQVFVRKIASYAFSHNVQDLTVICHPKNNHEFPSCLFSSQSLKHLTLSYTPYSFSPCVTPKTPWDFPALTTLHLSHITLCNDSTEKSLDLFSKCLNLKNLTLESFIVKGVEVFDINTPLLSNLMLIDGRHSVAINLIAPQLENLTIVDCSFEHLNAPAGLSSLYYKGCYPRKFSKYGLHSLKEVTIILSMYSPNRPYMEEDARNTINMLQELYSARNLTLNMNIAECISSFPDLLLHHPSPFSNLICLTIDPYHRDDAYQVNVSSEARNFLLGDSPSATFIMDLPEAPPTKAMKQKEARTKRKAKQAAEIENYMKELKAFVEQENIVAEQRKEMAAGFEKLISELNKEMEVQVKQGKAETESKQAWARVMEQLKICVGNMEVMVKDENEDILAISSNKKQVRLLLEKLGKKERAEVEARHSQLLEETEAQFKRLISDIVTLDDLVASGNQLIKVWSTKCHFI